MKISVITVVRNDLKGLKKTVESIISQSDLDFEYIIIDGDSTDGCKEFIASLQCPMPTKKVSEPDTGIYNAMNKGIKMATGDYCIFMNAGDKFYDKNVIHSACGVIGDADIYVGSTIKIGKHSIHKRHPLKNMTLTQLFLSRGIYHQSTITRTALLKEHPYREDLKIVSDWHFLFEQWLNGAKYETLNFVVSIFYIGGTSSDSETAMKEKYKVLEEIFPNERVRLSIMPQEKIWRKIYKAMAKSPISRDIALIKYGVKYLIRDLV